MNWSGIMTGVNMRTRTWRGGKPEFKWTNDQLDLLGTMPDSKIGRLIGCNGSTVTRKRKKLGIAQYVPQVEDKLPHAVREELGTMSDSALSRQTGLPYSHIRTERIKSGIPAFRDRVWTPTNVKLLGTMSDAKVAKKTGISEKVVYRLRKRLRIPAYTKSDLYKPFERKPKPKSLEEGGVGID